MPIYHIRVKPGSAKDKVIFDDLNQMWVFYIRAKPIDGDISVMLLEKAYAQMYGGWDNIHLGFNCDALRDLSGAPT